MPHATSAPRGGQASTGSCVRPAHPSVCRVEMRAMDGLVVLVLAAGGLVMPADTPDPARQAPPPPSPRMREHGTVLFEDDFRSTRLEGWRPDRAGVWRVQNGVLR